LPVLVSLLASERDMRLLLAKPTAGLAAFLALTAKLLVNFNWRTFHLVVAEGAL
jgi:hypothetical protein